MMKRYLLTTVLLLLIFFAEIHTAHQVNAETQEELQKLINAKNKEMILLEAERKSLESNLSNITRTNRSLSSEINGIDNTVKQLQINIQANRLAAEKLKYEIESMAYDIDNLSDSVETHRESLSKLITELQSREGEGFFITFIKKKTLSDNLLEYESIKALNGALIQNLNELRKEQTNLSRKLSESEKKKQEREWEQLTLANRQSIIEDQKIEKQRLLEQTKNQQKEYELKIEELERKQTEISRIIENYEEKIRLSFNPALLPTKRVGVFGYPVTNAVLTQSYGATKFAERAYKTKTHNGLDFGAPIGTPIYAAEDGIVKASENNDTGTSRWQKYQYGKYILINHNNNLATLYAHLSSQLVRTGDIVKRGDLIGYSGNTGYATGPHLHFGVYWAPSVELKSIPPANGLVPVGVTIDPADYL